LDRLDHLRQQVKDLQSIAARIAAGLEGADEDHDLQRFVVETLDMRGRLAIEDGQKVVYIQCMLADEALSSASHTIRAALRDCRPSSGSGRLPQRCSR